MLILCEVAQRVNSGALAVATVATRLANELWSDYEKLFHQLGVKRVVHLAVENREEAVADEKMHVLDNVKVVFFTGRAISSRSPANSEARASMIAFRKSTTAAEPSPAHPQAPRC